MRKFFSFLFLLVIVGAYLHYVQGWDFARVRREPIVTYFFPEDASATSTPIGLRGTGTHWETVKPMPKPRAAFGAAAAGNTIYVVGGIDGFFRTLSSAMAYDIGADAWRELPRLPQAVHHPAVVSDGKRIYVIGGLTGLASRPIDDVYAFDPEKNSWEQLGRLNDFRGASAAATLDGTLYVMGGVTTAGPDDAFEYYDVPRSGWNGLKSMSTARLDLAAASAGGRIFALGGRKGSVAKSLGTVEAYDPKKQIWESAPDMAVPRSAHAAVARDGLIYVLGGASKEGVVEEVEIFDTKKNAWSTMPLPMPNPRHGLAAVAWKDRIYAIGGGRRTGFAVSDLNEVLILK
ncbi:MAG TPA: kelch repeat-containing protein [Candidatus Baltobacteraceae bacterium]|nr:kelch repeat-containing protein [Candidatus Baltobacteraceae bacterium]